MPETPWDRRELLKAISAGAATGFLAGAARDAAAQQVKWSEGTQPPKLKAPPNACDCHHHIYDAKYPVDPKAVLRPGDALVEDYRAFQKRIGTSRGECRSRPGLRLEGWAGGNPFHHHQDLNRLRRALYRAGKLRREDEES
jgi:hypothetical protein